MNAFFADCAYSSAALFFSLLAPSQKAAVRLSF